MILNYTCMLYTATHSEGKETMDQSLVQLATQLGAQLKNRSIKLVTAESCTGGGLAYYLTSVPGSSEWFERGFVTYSNDAKNKLLKVKLKTLSKFGAVSEETAREMAEGALKNSKATISISITGIAGPGGGTKEKPVGTVWIGFAGVNIKTECSLVIFPGTRLYIREQTIQFVLETLVKLSGTPS